MLSQQDKKYLNKSFVGKKDHDNFVDSVAIEFTDIHQQFRAIDKRFEQVDKRFDDLEDLINEVLLEVRSTNRKLDATISRVDDHDLRIAQLEAQPGLSIL